MDELGSLQDRIKTKLHELRNIRRESECLKQFITDKKMSEEYYRYRIEYYKRKQYKK